MVNKFSAIVGSDCVDVRLVGRQQTDDHIINYQGALAGHVLLQIKSGIALNQAHDGPAALLPCWPRTVSTSQSPNRLRSSTVVGRSSIDTRLRMTLRLVFLPLR